MNVEGLTNIGLIRNTNQDNFLINKKYNLFLVADGMGGHESGDVASSIAVKTVEEFFEKYWNNKSTADLLEKAFKEANRAINNYSKKFGENYLMGTTLTAAVINNKTAYIAHVGDSRAYLINKDTIKLITTDHSYVRELVRNGSISEEEAVLHPHKNILTRALGIDKEVNFDLLEITLEKNDLLLLCTDGLFNCLSDELIHNIVKKAACLKEANQNLINESLNFGGEDNITVVLIEAV
jgi:protein phosphatase